MNTFFDICIRKRNGARRPHNQTAKGADSNGYAVLTLRNPTWYSIRTSVPSESLVNQSRVHSPMAAQAQPAEAEPARETAAS